MASELLVEAIPAFDDNYIWLLSRSGCDACAVVDPGDEDPVIETLMARGLRLVAVLVTHKHGDHVGGLRALKARWPEAIVYGPANEPIRHLDRTLGQGDRVQIPELDVVFDVLDVPGHTEGHIAYVGDGALFCGDTLFAGGCGRVFSGTFEQLSHSLNQLAQLPADTRVYCAHEYTQDNLGFAKWVEPENPDLLLREQRVSERRATQLPTVPSTLGDEVLTNPFMRTDEPVVIAAAEKWAGHALHSSSDVFTALRRWKDSEYD